MTQKKAKGHRKRRCYLMTSLGDFVTQEGAAVACAKRRDALCYVRFMIQQISVPALNTCVKMLRECSERAKNLAPTSAVRHTSEQTDASKYKRASRTGTNEEGRRNMKVLK